MYTIVGLIRHGVTDWNYAGRIQGRSDIPLAPEGHAQAKAVAQRLAKEPWDVVYSSPPSRAHLTAKTISDRLGHSKVLTDPRLMERNMGEAEGIHDTDLAVLWPGVAWQDIPGMEPVTTLAARSHAVLTEIANRHHGGRVVCVTHSSFIRHFLGSLQPAHQGPSSMTQPRTTSITTVKFDGRRFVQAAEPDHRHILQDGVEYSGEKGRVTLDLLMPLLADHHPLTSWADSIVWSATAVESAWINDRLVGFARAFTDSVLYGCIDMAVTLPGYEHVRSVLIARLTNRYPKVQLRAL